MKLRSVRSAPLIAIAIQVALAAGSVSLLWVAACARPGPPAPVSSPSSGKAAEPRPAAPPPSIRPSGPRGATSAPVSIAKRGKSHRIQYGKKRSYDFEDDAIEGDLVRPSAEGGASDNASPTLPQKKVVTISEVTIADDTIERYPNIEAPDTVTDGQEIAVQVSLTREQIAPETKILSGAQHEGKLHLNMGAGDDQWTLTVNLTAPGMEFTRNGNTSQITIQRDGDSTLAVFYLRPKAGSAAPRETQILATLLHDGAFIARLSRPLTIVASTSQPGVTAAPVQQPAATQLASEQPDRAAAKTTPQNAQPAMRFDLDLEAPNLTIVENRVGNTLRVVFFSGHTTPVEADIADPDALHAWIEAHYARMASHSRGFEVQSDAQQSSAQYDADYIDGFGSELYDRFAPQQFKELFWKLMDSSANRNPANSHAKGQFESIQVLSDDPAIPWELMRPVRADGTQRMDFLGLHFMIARWPLGGRTESRPLQSLSVSRSAVIAPVYRGGLQLASAGKELTAIKSIQSFAEVGGDYASVRELAMHPPQGIVHFAGHGAVTDQGGVPQFAILLQDSQMDPSTWQALGVGDTRTHPLFFFNACDVGESRRFLNSVDGWAPVLLSSGASGYIGALWPVNDATAEAVAASFYGHLSAHISAGGANVAEALARARADVFSQTSDPTALAYVFYGDPYLTLDNTAEPGKK